jgi:hypothetical protein
MLAVGILIPGAVLTAVLLEQRFPEFAQAVFGPQLTEWMTRVPRLTGPMFVLLILVDLYTFSAFVRLRRRLRQKDIRSQERVAVV